MGKDRLSHYSFHQFDSAESKYLNLILGSSWEKAILLKRGGSRVYQFEDSVFKIYALDFTSQKTLETLPARSKALGAHGLPLEICWQDEKHLALRMPFIKETNSDFPPSAHSLTISWIYELQKAWHLPELYCPRRPWPEVLAWLGHRISLPSPLLDRLEEALTTKILPFENAVVHGDLRKENILWQQGCPRVFDYEEIHWGDPLEDVWDAFGSKAPVTSTKNLREHFKKAYYLMRLQSEHEDPYLMQKYASFLSQGLKTDWAGALSSALKTV